MATAKLLYRRLDSLFGTLKPNRPARRVLESFVEEAFRTLRDDLWLRNATHANEMAARLAHAVKGISGVRITQPVESNAVFAVLPREATQRLLAQWPGDTPFHIWSEYSGEVRWMTAWDTTEADVDRFAEAVAEAVGAEG